METERTMWVWYRAKNTWFGWKKPSSGPSGQIFQLFFFPNIRKVTLSVDLTNWWINWSPERLIKNLFVHLGADQLGFTEELFNCLIHSRPFFRAVISFCTNQFVLLVSCVRHVPLTLLWLLQAVPDEEPLPHPAFPPPGATPPLWHCRVLPAAFHRNALLHLLLPGGGLCDQCVTLRMKSNESFFIWHDGHVEGGGGRGDC